MSSILKVVRVVIKPVVLTGASAGAVFLGVLEDEKRRNLAVRNPVNPKPQEVHISEEMHVVHYPDAGAAAQGMKTVVDDVTAATEEPNGTAAVEAFDAYCKAVIGQSTAAGQDDATAEQSAAAVSALEEVMDAVVRDTELIDALDAAWEEAAETEATITDQEDAREVREVVGADPNEADISPEAALDAPEIAPEVVAEAELTVWSHRGWVTAADAIVIADTAAEAEALTVWTHRGWVTAADAIVIADTTQAEETSPVVSSSERVTQQPQHAESLLQSDAVADAMARFRKALSNGSPQSEAEALAVDADRGKLATIAGAAVGFLALAGCVMSSRRK